MNAPMVGSWTVRVHAVKPYSIHGDQYYELHVERDDQPGVLVAVRVPEHAVKEGRVVGDRLTVRFLMGQVTGAVKV
jgi:hypothetical protein